MPADSPPRKITFHKVPYDHYFGRTAIMCFSEPGEFTVKAEVADRAVSLGYATEGWASDERRRPSTKGRSRRTRKAATAKADAATIATDDGTDAGLAGAGLSADDSAAVRGAVDQAAE